MKLTLRDFRNAANTKDEKWLSADLRPAGKGGKPSFGIKVSSRMVPLRPLANDANSNNRRTGNAYMRGQLLLDIRDSLIGNSLMKLSSSGGKQTVTYLGGDGKGSGPSKTKVEKFFRKAEYTLYGPISKGGASTAGQDLSTKTVNGLLDELQSLIDLKAKSDAKKGIVRAKVPDYGGWTLMDVPEKLKTPAQQLREHCPHATDAQKAALGKLDPRSLQTVLAIGRSEARGLKVQTVRPSRDLPEGYLECRLAGPNGSTPHDVVVDQAGVMIPKGKISKASVEAAEYQKLADAVAVTGLGESNVALAIAKVFAPSDCKIVAGLFEALSGLGGLGLFGGPEWFAGVLLHKLPKALQEARKSLKPGNSTAENIVALWSSLGLPKPVPGKDEKDLNRRFAMGLLESVLDDQLKVWIGPNPPPALRKNLFKWLTENDKRAIKEYGLGFCEVFKKRMDYAASLSGVPYDLQMKCRRNHEYIPTPNDRFFNCDPWPSIDEHLMLKVKLPNKRKPETLSKAEFEEGKKEGKYKGAQVIGRSADLTILKTELSNLGTETDRMNGAKIFLGKERIDPYADPKVKFNTEEEENTHVLKKFVKPLEAQGFSPEQILRVIDCLDEGTLSAFAFGMDSNGRDSVITVEKGANGDMKLSRRRPSKRYAKIVKPHLNSGVLKFKNVTSKLDFVHEMNVGRDGTVRTTAFKLVKSPRTKDVVTYEP